MFVSTYMFILNFANFSFLHVYSNLHVYYILQIFPSYMFIPPYTFIRNSGVLSSC